MPKPDANKDYYGILDVKGDASVDEIKKAYHKLAFKWHPDRNHGREQDAATKFQDVSNAYEILIEPTTKTKYDNDRAKLQRKATTPFTSPTNPLNPYASFQAPRPNNAPSSMKSPPAGTGGAQYAQYTTQTNAPWSNPAAQARAKAPPPEAWRTWDSMKAGGTAAAVRGYPPGAVPARGGNNGPTRPKPAAFGPTSSNAGPTPKVRAGWSEPEDPRQPPRPTERRPGPGISRSNTTRSPRRTGFDPLAGYGDEPPARNTSAYQNIRGGIPRGARPQSFVHPSTPLSNQSAPRPRSAHYEDLGAASADENPGERLSTPYSTGGGEKTYFSSANLYRNRQPESANSLGSGWDEGGSKHRHRSASPRMRSPRGPAVEESDSSEGTSSEEESPRSRTKLQPKSRHGRRSPPLPRSASPSGSKQPSPEEERHVRPGLTVENEFGKVHEFSKPMRSSTWNMQTDAARTQAQRLAEESTNRRTSTGNISETSQRSPQPSPLHKATNVNAEKDFEPLEKPMAWRQQYGSPPNTANQRRFEPPGQNLKSNGGSTADDSTDSASPAKNDRSYFESQNWQQKFSTTGPNPFVPQNLPGQASPVKGKGHGNLRVPRKNSVPRKHAVPRGVRSGSDADSVPSMSSSTESVSSGNAMDIDVKTPPGPANGSIYPSGPQSSNSRRDQDDRLNLKELRNTAPFAPTNSSGLGDLKDLGANLPFDSKAASTLPFEGVNVHKLTLPHPPRLREHPNTSTLRKEEWERYLVVVCKYMNEWKKFNQRMLQHFNARQYAVDNDLPKNWLAGIGEGGLSRYMSWLEEDNRVRTHWEASFELHQKDMEEFQRVKKCASSAKFVVH